MPSSAAKKWKTLLPGTTSSPLLWAQKKKLLTRPNYESQQKQAKVANHVTLPSKNRNRHKQSKYEPEQKQAKVVNHVTLTSKKKNRRRQAMCNTAAFKNTAQTQTLKSAPSQGSTRITGANRIEVEWKNPLIENAATDMGQIKSHSPSPPRQGPVGRGRGVTLPAWMTKRQEASAPSIPQLKAQDSGSENGDEVRLLNHDLLYEMDTGVKSQDETINQVDGFNDHENINLRSGLREDQLVDDSEAGSEPDVNLEREDEVVEAEILMWLLESAVEQENEDNPVPAEQRGDEDVIEDEEEKEEEEDEEVPDPQEPLRNFLVSQMRAFDTFEKTLFRLGPRPPKGPPPPDVLAAQESDVEFWVDDTQGENEEEKEEELGEIWMDEVEDESMVEDRRETADLEEMDNELENMEGTAKDFEDADDVGTAEDTNVACQNMHDSEDLNEVGENVDHAVAELELFRMAKHDKIEHQEMQEERPEYDGLGLYDIWRREFLEKECDGVDPFDSPSVMTATPKSVAMKARSKSSPPVPKVAQTDSDASPKKELLVTPAEKDLLVHTEVQNDQPSIDSEAAKDRSVMIATPKAAGAHLPPKAPAMLAINEAALSAKSTSLESLTSCPKSGAKAMPSTGVTDATTADCSAGHEDMDCNSVTKHDPSMSKPKVASKAFQPGTLPPGPLQPGLLPAGLTHTTVTDGGKTGNLENAATQNGGVMQTSTLSICIPKPAGEQSKMADSSEEDKVAVFHRGVSSLPAPDPKAAVAAAKCKAPPNAASPVAPPVAPSTIENKGVDSLPQPRVKEATAAASTKAPPCTGSPDDPVKLSTPQSKSSGPTPQDDNVPRVVPPPPKPPPHRSPPQSGKIEGLQRTLPKASERTPNAQPSMPEPTWREQSPLHQNAASSAPEPTWPSLRQNPPHHFPHPGAPHPLHAPHPPHQPHPIHPPPHHPYPPHPSHVYGHVHQNPYSHLHQGIHPADQQLSNITPHPNYPQAPPHQPHPESQASSSYPRSQPPPSYPHPSPPYQQPPPNEWFSPYAQPTSHPSSSSTNWSTNVRPAGQDPKNVSPIAQKSAETKNQVDLPQQKENWASRKRSRSRDQIEKSTNEDTRHDKPKKHRKKMGRSRSRRRRRDRDSSRKRKKRSRNEGISEKSEDDLHQGTVVKQENLDEESSEVEVVDHHQRQTGTENRSEGRQDLVDLLKSRINKMRAEIQADNSKVSSLREQPRAIHEKGRPSEQSMSGRGIFQ